MIVPFLARAAVPPLGDSPIETGALISFCAARRASLWAGLGASRPEPASRRVTACWTGLWTGLGGSLFFEAEAASYWGEVGDWDVDR